MPRYDEWFKELVGAQVANLERSAGLFQKVQDRLPKPSPQEIEEVRTRQRPMNRYEYILARLQRVVIALENVASDLRLDLEYDFEPAVYLLAADVNALEAAVEESRAAGEKVGNFADRTVGPGASPKKLEEITKKD